MTWKSSGLFFCICALTYLLIAITWILFEKVDHFQNVGDNLLQNSSFTAGLNHWGFSTNLASSGNLFVDLSNAAQSESHYIHQTLAKPTSGYVRISADAQLVDVRIGAEVWQKARVDVLGRKPGGRWQWDFPNTLFAETGTGYYKNVSTVIHVPDVFTEIRVEAELTGGTGRFIVNRISLREVAPRSGVKGATDLLLCFWILLIVAVVVSLLRSSYWIPLLVLLVVGFLLLLIPEPARMAVQRIFVVEELAIPFDHLVLFLAASLTLFFYARQHDIPVYLTFFGLITLSAASEILQYYASHRNPTVLDELTNMAAIFAAMLIFLVVQMVVKIRPFTL